MAYLDLASAKQYIGNTKTTDDALLNALIGAAQAFIEGPLGAGRVYEATGDTTKYFDAQCDVQGRMLNFGSFECCQITTVLNGDGGSIPSTEYVTEPRNKVPFYALTLKTGSAYVWQWTTSPENAIAITGRWSYSLTAPERIVQLMREIVAYMYRRKDASGDADRPMLTGDGVTILPSMLPRGIMGQLIAERDRL